MSSSPLFDNFGMGNARTDEDNIERCRMASIGAGGGGGCCKCKYLSEWILVHEPHQTTYPQLVNTRYVNSTKATYPHLVNTGYVNSTKAMYPQRVYTRYINSTRATYPQRVDAIVHKLHRKLHILSE